MAKRKHEGTCRIRGACGPLSFEHVPPKAACNDRPVVEVAVERVLALGLDGPPKGRINRRGTDAHTLCPTCTSETGSWDADAFAEWCWQGADVLVRSGGRRRPISLRRVLPRRLIKQIAVTAFSANSAGYRARHPERVRFVLDQERRDVQRWGVTRKPAGNTATPSATWRATETEAVVPASTRPGALPARLRREGPPR